MDVLPLRARLDRAALVNSATGEISPLRSCRDASLTGRLAVRLGLHLVEQVDVVRAGIRAIACSVVNSGW